MLRWACWADNASASGSSALGLRAKNEAPNSPLRDNVVVLRLGTIVLGADDVGRAATFWADVLGYAAVTFPGSSDDFTILVPPDRVGTRVAVHRSVTPVQERPGSISILWSTAVRAVVRGQQACGAWCNSRAVGLLHRC